MTESTILINEEQPTRNPAKPEPSNATPEDPRPRPNEPPTKQQNGYDDYTVGWLCALPCELNASRALLDERHEPLDQADNDDNSYLLGRMGKHNVVIAYTGAGTNSAAHTATNLLRTFRNIRFGLMVGIGGGAPAAPDVEDPFNDIRLGDVVVSRAEKNHGGVLQYDRGKQTHDGVFRIESHLNKPPALLSKAVELLESDHANGGGEMTNYIHDIAVESRRLPGLRRYRFPGRHRDLLFRSDYSHATGKDCSRCDVTHVEYRLERESDDPVVHYGLIGSSNAVMKSARLRDRLRSEWDVICFEMEAAGLMDNFPCVVIRGISDYSDDHKHDDWQPYAAVVAAAYAKDLLRVIQPPQVRRIEIAAVEMSKQLMGLQNRVEAGFAKTHDQTAGLIDEHQRNRARETLEWLCSTDYGPLQSDNLHKQQPGTGQWLLESAEFQQFLQNDKQTLLCTGIPGAGKTILTSIIIDHLISNIRREHTTGIAYVYCSYQRQSDQNAYNLVASVLKQLVQALWPLPTALEELHQRHIEHRTRPSIGEISTVLQCAVSAYSKVFIIIDALDECQTSDGCLSTFLSEVMSLQTQANVSILATSRVIPQATEAFDGNPVLQIHAHERDVRKYIDGQIYRLPGFVARSPELQDEIKAAIIESVDGMFLLAQLHLDSLVGEMSPKSIRAALKNLPKGSGAYDTAYNMAMERVQSQIHKQASLARGVLSWLTGARRRLTTKELQHALAVEVGESKLDVENIPELDDIVSVCRGLVTVDHESRVVRLAHYTTQEYFERTQKRWFPDAQYAIADVCATYLSFDVFASGRRSDEFAIERRVKKNPLYLYATYNWGYHASSTSVCPDSVLRFLQQTGQTEASSQLLFADLGDPFGKPYPPYLMGRHLVKINIAGMHVDNDKGAKITGLHLAAYLGVAGAVEVLRDKMDINARDSEGRTPLAYAAESGRVRAAELLLKRNADLHLPDSEGRTPLIHAAQGGFQKTIRLLVDHGANVDCIDESGRTPLVLAASMDCLPMIQMLLNNGASLHPVDSFGNTCLKWAVFNNSPETALIMLRKDPQATSHPGGWLSVFDWAVERGYKSLLTLLVEQGLPHETEAQTGHRRSAILKAAGHGDERAVKLLLGAGATVNPEGIVKVTPLSLAALNGHRDMVLLLLKNGARVNQELEFGRTPLVSAIRSGNPGVVKLLLDHGAEIEAEDYNHWTPLSHAVDNHDISIARLLLAKGANPDFMGASGQTLLMSAVANGDQDMAALLLNYAANVDCRDTKGCGVLYYAVDKHRLGLVRLLLAKGTNLEAREKNGQTPLIQAVLKGHGETVALLLEYHAQIDAQDCLGRTALWYAADQGNQGGVKVLLLHGADTNWNDAEGSTPMSRALMNGHMQVAKLLLEHHVDNLSINHSDGETFLAWAAKNGDDTVIAILLQKGIGVDFTDSAYGQTPIGLAAGEGHIQAVALLLAGHGQPDVTDKLGRTPLLRAAERGHPSIVEQLLKCGANINAADTLGQTPLIQAAKEGHDTIIRLLLENGAFVDMADNNGRTALVFAAKEGHNAVLKLLLEQKANVNSADQDGRTPLTWAAMQGHDTAVVMLLHYGATADHKDHSNKTPLAMAALKGHTSTVQLLLRPDVDIDSEDKSGRTPLFWAVYWNSIATTQVLLVNGADPRRTDRDGRNTLAWAVDRGQATMVNLLLDHDETLADQDEHKTALLLKAAQHGHTDVVQVLLDKGQDVDLIDLEYGRSALWYAADGGHLEIVRLLLERGATIDLPDNDSRTPLDQALTKKAMTKGENPAVVALLAEHTDWPSVVEVSAASSFSTRRYEG